MALDVPIPQHRQRDVFALELAVDLAPTGLDVTAMTLLLPIAANNAASTALSVISAGNGH